MSLHVTAAAVVGDFLRWPGASTNIYPHFVSRNRSVLIALYNHRHLFGRAGVCARPTATASDAKQAWYARVVLVTASASSCREQTASTPTSAKSATSLVAFASDSTPATSTAISAGNGAAAAAAAAAASASASCFCTTKWYFPVFPSFRTRPRETSSTSGIDSDHSSQCGDGVYRHVIARLAASILTASASAIAASVRLSWGGTGYWCTNVVS